MQNQRSEGEMGYLNRAFTQNQKFHKNLGLKWTKTSATSRIVRPSSHGPVNGNVNSEVNASQKAERQYSKKFGQPAEFSARWPSYGSNCG